MGDFCSFGEISARLWCALLISCKMTNSRPGRPQLPISLSVFFGLGFYAHTLPHPILGILSFHFLSWQRNAGGIWAITRDKSAPLGDISKEPGKHHFWGERSQDPCHTHHSGWCDQGKYWIEILFFINDYVAF